MPYAYNEHLRPRPGPSLRPPISMAAAPGSLLHRRWREARLLPSRGRLKAYVPYRPTAAAPAPPPEHVAIDIRDPAAAGTRPIAV
jgi:hypothetical protein